MCPPCRSPNLLSLLSLVERRWYSYAPGKKQVARGAAPESPARAAVHSDLQQLLSARGALTISNPALFQKFQEETC